MTTVETAARIPATQLLGVDISMERSVEDALARAGMDWTVTELPTDEIRILSKGGVTAASFPGKRLFVRSDNNIGLYLGGGRYTPVNNVDAFGAANAAAAMGAQFVAAGEREHGRKCFMALDLPDATIHVGGVDLVKFELLLTTSHDGGSVTGEVRGRRLICMNGMTVDLTEQHRWAVAHTASAPQRLEEAKTMMQGAVRYATEFAAAADRMLDTRMTARQFTSFIDRLYPEPDKSEKSKHTRWSNRRDDLINLFKFADTNELGRNTRWGGWGAVTEQLDWLVSAKDATARAERQIESPQHQQIRNRAWQELLRA